VSVARSALAAAIALLALASACEKKKAPPPPPADAAAAGAAVPPALPLRELDAQADAPEPTDDDAYLAGAPKSGRSIGHTSVVLKLELDNGKKAAFKPHTRRGPGRYRGEIAAYRLAVALGLPNVPRAFARTFPEGALASSLGDGTPARELFTKEVLTDGGAVRGALIPWVDGLEILPLEKEPWWSRFRVWLKKGAPIIDPVTHELGADGFLGLEAVAVARDASALLVFDWLTANFDRWSGGNVGWDRRKKRVLFIDNDGAFLDPPQAAALARSKRMVEDVDRFSRDLVTRLRAMSDADLTRALGEEIEGRPLLSPKVTAGVAARKKELLAVIAAKVAANGEAETLYFP
jgi:hypothetical protein